MERDREKALQIMNKLHLLTYFIVKCEEHTPLQTDENEWHPDFEEAMGTLLYVNENGYAEEDDMRRMNELFSKWSDRFQELGFLDQPLSEHSELEDEIFELLEDYYNKHA